MDKLNESLADIVRSTLLTLDLYSPDAEQLVLATAMVEQNLRHDHDQSAQKGIYNISQRMHDDLWLDFLEYRPEIVRQMCKLANLDLRKLGLDAKFNLLDDDPYYATALCRLMYLRIPKSLPDASNKEALAVYWLLHFHLDKDAFASDVAMINSFKAMINYEFEIKPL